MITDADVRTAREQARDAGPLVMLLLLLRDYGKRVSFDPSKGTFVVEGKTVGVRVMRKLVKQAEEAASGRLKKLTEDLMAKRIAPAEWRRRMAQEVAAAHLLMAALAAGSLEEARRSVQVQKRVEEEKDHVAGFYLAVKAGKLSAAMALARAASYTLAAAATFGIVEHWVKGFAGYTEARRIRRASESCRGCLAYAGRWIRIQLMPPIGSLECGSHCRCYLIYR